MHQARRRADGKDLQRLDHQHQLDLGFISGSSGHPAYSASKRAVLISTNAAAARDGPQGVRVKHR